MILHEASIIQWSLFGIKILMGLKKKLSHKQTVKNAVACLISATLRESHDTDNGYLREISSAGLQKPLSLIDSFCFCGYNIEGYIIY